MSYIFKPFTEEEFLRLFILESSRSLRKIRDDPQIQPKHLPSEFRYLDGSEFSRFFPSDEDSHEIPTDRIYRAETLVPRLFRDGEHRQWINLGPVGYTLDWMLFEVSYSDVWTDHRHVGETAYPGEPFQLVGPALPRGWRDGDPMPEITLPTIIPISEQGVGLKRVPR